MAMLFVVLLLGFAIPLHSIDRYRGDVRCYYAAFAHYLAIWRHSTALFAWMTAKEYGYHFNRWLIGAKYLKLKISPCQYLLHRYFSEMIIHITVLSFRRRKPFDMTGGPWSSCVSWYGKKYSSAQLQNKCDIKSLRCIDLKCGLPM